MAAIPSEGESRDDSLYDIRAGAEMMIAHRRRVPARAGLVGRAFGHHTQEQRGNYKSEM
jgi:hypothetical protein